MDFRTTRKYDEVVLARLDDGRSSKVVPYLLGGRHTIAVIRDWTEAVREYADYNKVKDRDLVGKVMGGLKDVFLAAWVRTSANELKAMEFEAFVEQVKLRALGATWALDQMRIVRSIRMSSHETCERFVVRLCEANDLLLGHDLRLDDSGLRAHIFANITPDLQRALDENHAALAEKTDFTEWIKEVYKYDTKRIADAQRIDELVRQSLPAPSRSNSSHRPPSPNAAPNVPTTRNGNGKRTRGADSEDEPARKRANEFPYFGKSRVGPLDPAQGGRLRANGGCPKCRILFVCHERDDCTNAWPDPNTYRYITDDLVAAERAKLSAAELARVDAWVRDRDAKRLTKGNNANTNHGNNAGADKGKGKGRVAAHVTARIPTRPNENVFDSDDSSDDDDLATRGATPRCPPPLVTPSTWQGIHSSGKP